MNYSNTSGQAVRIKAMGSSSSRQEVRVPQRERAPLQFERLSWTESLIRLHWRNNSRFDYRYEWPMLTQPLSSASSSTLGEYPEFRRKEGDSLASHFTLERQTDDPDSPVTFLSLAFEELTVLPIKEIPDQFFNQVHSLDLSNNRFTDVQFLTEFERLTSVNLDRNRLDCLTAFPRLPELRSLSLNFNRVLALHPFVTSLAIQCPNLIFLSMMGNELCPNYLNGGTEQQNELYRLHVIRLFPELGYLDDGPVTALEREKALALPPGPYCNQGQTSEVGQSSLASVDEGIETE